MPWRCNVARRLCWTAKPLSHTFGLANGARELRLREPMNKNACARSLEILAGFLVAYSQVAAGETVTYDVHLYEKRTCIDSNPCVHEPISRDIEVTADVPETLPDPFVVAGPESTDSGSYVYTFTVITRNHPNSAPLTSPLTAELLALKSRQGPPIEPGAVIQSDEYFFAFPDGVEDNGGARADIEVNQNRERQEEGTCCTDYSSWEFSENLSLNTIVPLGSAADVQLMSDAQTIAMLHGGNGATVTFSHGVTETNIAFVNGEFQEGPRMDTTYTGTATVRTAIAYTLKPAALDFGKQAVSTDGPAKSFTLINKGSAAMPISSIQIVGANRTMFSSTHDCGGSLAAGASCTINVTFRPTAQGSKAASLRVIAGGVTRNRPLTGKGVAAAPAYSLSTDNIAFGDQRRDTTSAPCIVTLTNTGSVPVHLQSVANQSGNPGMFPIANFCSNRIPAGASCKISVRFHPKSNGAKSTTLRIVGADGAPTRTVALSGTGVSAP